MSRGICRVLRFDASILDSFALHSLLCLKHFRRATSVHTVSSTAISHEFNWPILDVVERIDSNSLDIGPTVPDLLAKFECHHIRYDPCLRQSTLKAQ